MRIYLRLQRLELAFDAHRLLSVIFFDITRYRRSHIIESVVYVLKIRRNVILYADVEISVAHLPHRTEQP